MQVLAGDIGGTHSRLQLLEGHGRSWRVRDEQVLDSAGHRSFEALLAAFLSRARPDAVAAACLAVAGPVHDQGDVQRVALTNLPWRLDSRALAGAFGIPRLRLINDFQAIGYGLAALGSGDLAVLQPGAADARGPRALLGAGTGLGQALVIDTGSGEQVIATEGGHADFAPTDALQLDLLGALLAREAHVSYEHLLSGPGLVRLYHYLRERGGFAPSASIAAAMETGDPAAVISGAALAGSDPLCMAALELFVRIYGAQAGNLALAAGATGGVYLAGGIAPRILARLTDGAFIEAFRNKGRMRALLETVPVRVVTHPGVGLIGAGRCAAALAGDAA